MGRTKKIILFIIISLAAILFIDRYSKEIIGITYVVYEIINGGSGTQNHINEHSKIGQKVKFSQPIGYIVRHVPSIVPIVAETKNELGSIHPKLDSEAINEYIPSDTNFTIVDVFTYRDIVNPQTYFFVLSDQQHVHYTVKESTYESLVEPIFQGARAPVDIFDNLYRRKNSVNVRFAAMKRKSPRLIPEYFSKCNVQNFTLLKWEQEATATINFNQLVCLYQYFWRDFNSETFPISFEVLK